MHCPGVITNIERAIGQDRRRQSYRHFACGVSSASPSRDQSFPKFSIFGAAKHDRVNVSLLDETTTHLYKTFFRPNLRSTSTSCPKPYKVGEGKLIWHLLSQPRLSSIVFIFG